MGFNPSVHSLHRYSHPKFFHNSRLFGWIQQKKIYKTFRGLTRDWTQINCLGVSHSNYYTGMFSMFVWGYNWILFMNGRFCPIHLIRRKSLHFEKNRLFSYVLIRQLTVWTKSYNLEIHGFGFFMKLSNIIKNDAKIKINIMAVLSLYWFANFKQKFLVVHVQHWNHNFK